jgi:hypothetical protein
MFPLRWNSPVTSYPPGGVEVLEREETSGTGGSALEMSEEAAAEAVGKWESRSDFHFPTAGESPAAAGRMPRPWLPLISI